MSRPPTAASGDAAPRLLAIFAHPDDESLAAGGLLALAADAGAVVTVLCLTRGEASDATADDAVRRALGEKRTRELQAAARVLGVTGVEVRDHADGMLPWLDHSVLEADIRTAFARVLPDVVITFGPDGLYWHPDHIAVSERTTTVVAGMAPAPALYFVTTPPGQMRALVDEARRRGGPGWVIRGLDDPDAFGTLAAAPSLVVDTTGVASRKLAALVCHRSQTAGGALDALTPADAARYFGTEHYRRAEVGRVDHAFIERFAAAAVSRAADSD